ncbi:MAG: 3-coathanger stack domain-containing protein [Limisphaerales bacterium]
MNPLPPITRLWLYPCLLLLCSSPLTAANSLLPTLFQHDPGSENASAGAAMRELMQRPTTLRATRAHWTPDAFTNQRFILNPFADVNLDATHTPIGFTGARHQTWFGTLSNNQGSAVFILNGGRISGKINSTSGTFEIFPQENQSCLIVQHGLAHWPGCNVNSLTSPQPLANSPANSSVASDVPTITMEDSPGQDTPSENPIRVIIAYTAGAQFKTRAIYGRTMREHVDLALAETNQGYANSGVNLRLELACLYETGFLETTAIENDVEDFRNNGDGKGDEVHQLRADFDADMCCLITDGRDYSWCGWSYGFDYTSRDNMFQATSYSCATGNFSFAHEFGHTQGCRHNDDLALLPFAYGHGYRKDTYWATIMAMTTGTTAVRLNYWSNPRIPSPLLPHTPMGTPEDGDNFANDCCTALNVSSETVINHESTPSNSDAPTNHSFSSDEFADKLVTDTLTVATFTANPGAQIQFRAGSSIILQPGFHAQAGSQFQATITTPEPPP